MSYDEKTPILSKIKAVLIEYVLTRTSFYGFSNIFKTKFIAIRIFWSLIVVFFISYLLYCIKESAINYLSYEVFTKIEVIGEVLPIFPAVTICNSNPFVTEFSNEFLKNISKINNRTNRNIDENTWKNLIDEKRLILSYAYKKTLTNKIKKKFGYKINEAILRCTFESTECSLDNDFDWVYDNDYGNCFTFNANTNNSKLKTVSRIGKMFGLQMDLFVGYNKTAYNSIFGQGAHIFINNQSEKTNDGFDMSIGFQTSIGIKRLLVQKKEYPYSQCQNVYQVKDKSTFVSKILNSKQTYKQVDCFDLCIQDYLLKKCNCTRNATDKYGGIRHCEGNEQMECNAKLTENINQSLWEKGICIKECPIECNSIQYQMTISQIDYPSEQLADLMKLDPLIKEKFKYSTPISYNDLKHSLVSLNIYYDELGYTLIKEIPKCSLIDFISSIGGIIGLLLGTSFVSLMEIFEIIFLISKISYDEILRKYRHTNVIYYKN